jgi:hypothetical protein
MEAMENPGHDIHCFDLDSNEARQVECLELYRCTNMTFRRP